MNHLGWTPAQWTIAYEWYELTTGEPAPPRTLEGAVVVNQEWQIRGKPAYGPTHDTVRTVPRGLGWVRVC